MLLCVVHDQDSLLIARQMVATNTNVKLLFQGLGPQLASYREALGKYSESILCSTYWDESVPYKDKFFGDARKFTEYYRSKFTRPIAYHVAGAAACIETYVMAMQAAKSLKPEPVRDALAAADYETFYARIKFTPDGDGDPLTLGGMIGQVQKGKLETVFPEAASRPPPSIRRSPGTRRLEQRGISPPSSGEVSASYADGGVRGSSRVAHDASAPEYRRASP